MEKKSIEEQIMVRIFNEPDKATEYLSRLTTVEQGMYFKSTELKEAYSFLIGEDIQHVDIDNLNKILEKLKKTLVKKINDISKTGDFYELIILLLALMCLNDEDELNSEVLKNDRVELCYNLIVLILDNCKKAEVGKWFNKDLKKLRFN